MIILKFNFDFKDTIKVRSFVIEHMSIFGSILTALINKEKSKVAREFDFRFGLSRTTYDNFGVPIIEFVLFTDKGDRYLRKFKKALYKQIAPILEVQKYIRPDGTLPDECTETFNSVNDFQSISKCPLTIKRFFFDATDRERLTNIDYNTITGLLVDGEKVTDRDGPVFFTVMKETTDKEKANSTVYAVHTPHHFRDYTVFAVICWGNNTLQVETSKTLLRVREFIESKGIKTYGY